jgi:hypothetical protein
VPFGVADVHAGQVGGEKRRLLAALPRLHLQHDVVGIVRVARGEQVGELGVELLDGGLELGNLGREGFVVGGELSSGFQIAAGGLQLAIGRHDGRHLREAAADLAGRSRIRVQIRVGQLTLEVGLLGQQSINRGRSVRHVRFLPRNANRRPACARAQDRASVKQLFVGGLISTGPALAVALLEAGHAAAAVEDLLLAGVERMALRADLDVDLSALLRAARGERVAAAAVDRGLDVVRVNT